MTITTPFTISATVLLFHQVDEGDLSPQPWIALAGLWLLLAFVGSSLGNIAVSIAWLIALGMIYRNGKAILDMMTGVLGKGTKDGR